MRAGMRRGFWRRVAVWWVTLTVVMVGLEVGAVWWVGSRPMTATGRAYWLVWRRDGRETHSHEFFVAQLSRISTRGEFGPIWADINYGVFPRVIRTADDSLDAVTADEIRSAYSGRLGPILRLRSVLGVIRKANYPNARVSAVDVACGLPIGMYVHGRSGWMGYPQHSGPRGLLATYPVEIVLEPKVTRVLLHRDALMLAAGVGALGVGAGVALGGVRRVRRQRRGRCVACGYSVVGIADDAPCPECGEKR